MSFFLFFSNFKLFLWFLTYINILFFFLLFKTFFLRVSRLAGPCRTLNFSNFIKKFPTQILNTFLISIFAAVNCSAADVDSLGPVSVAQLVEHHPLTCFLDGGRRFDSCLIRLKYLLVCVSLRNCLQRN